MGKEPVSRTSVFRCGFGSKAAQHPELLGFEGIAIGAAACRHRPEPARDEATGMLKIPGFDSQNGGVTSLKKMPFAPITAGPTRTSPIADSVPAITAAIAPRSVKRRQYIE